METSHAVKREIQISRRGLGRSSSSAPQRSPPSRAHRPPLRRFLCRRTRSSQPAGSRCPLSRSLESSPARGTAHRRCPRHRNRHPRPPRRRRPQSQTHGPAGGLCISPEIPCGPHSPPALERQRHSRLSVGSENVRRRYRSRRQFTPPAQGLRSRQSSFRRSLRLCSRFFLPRKGPPRRQPDPQETGRTRRPSCGKYAQRNVEIEASAASLIRLLYFHGRSVIEHLRHSLHHLVGVIPHAHNRICSMLCRMLQQNLVRLFPCLFTKLRQNRNVSANDRLNSRRQVSQYAARAYRNPPHDPEGSHDPVSRQFIRCCHHRTIHSASHSVLLVFPLFTSPILPFHKPLPSAFPFVMLGLRGNPL